MIGILINPHTLFFKTVTLGTGKKRLSEIQDLIVCDTVSAVGFDYKDEAGTIYINDNGLHEVPSDFFYIPELYPMPLVGKGLILGFDPKTGESIDTSPKLLSNIINRKVKVQWLDTHGAIQVEENLRKRLTI